MRKGEAPWKSIWLGALLCLGASTNHGHSREGIPRIPVKSSGIASIGYDRRLGYLDVEFRNSAIYRYLKVSPELAAEFLGSESKGRFFALRIRGRFVFIKLGSTKP